MGGGEDLEKLNVGSGQLLGVVAMEMIVGREFRMDFAVSMFVMLFVFVVFMFVFLGMFLVFVFVVVSMIMLVLDTVQKGRSHFGFFQMAMGS